jgi:ribonuclease P protein component
VRLGLTVGRRVGGAALRNRVKRLLREQFRQHRSAFPPGTDLVAVATRALGGVMGAALGRAVAEAVRAAAAAAAAGGTRRAPPQTPAR